MSDTFSTATIPELFFRQAERLRDKPVFWFRRNAEPYRPLSWSQASDTVNALAAFLLKEGVAPGGRVLLLSENRPEWAIADIAVQSIGAWSVPIYASLRETDIRLIAADCSPVGCIVSSAEQLAKLRTIRGDLKTLHFIVCMDPESAADGWALTWEKAIREGREALSNHPKLLDERRANLRSDATATLIYTSGTTGEPKGVMLSHRNFLSNVAACLEVIPIGGGDQHLSFLPLSHVFERMAGLYLMIAVGASVAYAHTLETVAEDMLAFRPTVMLGVPRFFEKLYARLHEQRLQLPPLKRRIMERALAVGQAAAEYRLNAKHEPIYLKLQQAVFEKLVFSQIKRRMGGRLRFFVSGSAPLSAALGKIFYGMGIVILEGYGLTETSPVIAVNRPPMPRFGTVGPPIPGVMIRFAEDGEILTKGPHIMQGYFNRPDLTAQVVVDGWFHTGDIGHLDTSGCLVITDRKKDLIKTAGGKFVAPQKLEGRFLNEPQISQAFVYGDRRPYCVALIVPSKRALEDLARRHGLERQSPADIVKHPAVQAYFWELVQAKQRDLAAFEQVKRIALLDHEFSQESGELTPTLKAKRQVIAARYAELLNDLYAAQTSTPAG